MKYITDRNKGIKIRNMVALLLLSSLGACATSQPQWDGYAESTIKTSMNSADQPGRFYFYGGVAEPNASPDKLIQARRALGQKSKSISAATKLLKSMGLEKTFSDSLKIRNVASSGDKNCKSSEPIGQLVV